MLGAGEFKISRLYGIYLAILQYGNANIDSYIIGIEIQSIN